ncbi:hypothetical protein YC2023_011886 [Brassica napus]
MTNTYLHHKCFVDQGKYEPGSKYEENLNFIIEPIPVTSESFEKGTKMEMIGEGPDLISFTLQCRGDISGPRCRSCYATALSALHRRCPGYKGRMIWYDQCILEISTIDSLDKIDYNNNLCVSNAKKMMAHYYSNSDWLDLIHNLTTKALRQGNSKGMYYAAGETRLGMDNIYAMVQCSFYLSSKDCEKCLRHNIKHYEDCCFNRQGARVLGKPAFPPVARHSSLRRRLDYSEPLDQEFEDKQILRRFENFKTTLKEEVKQGDRTQGSLAVKHNNLDKPLASNGCVQRTNMTTVS